MSLGIDFGTTRTVVACKDRGNYPLVSFVDEAGDAWEWFPTVVAERNGQLRFGFDALAVAGDPSFTLVRSFKRLLSDPGAVPDRPIAIGSTVLTLEELVFRFAAALREAMRSRSNLTGTLPTRAVLAVPAGAHGAQRFITIHAFRRAGFDVVALLNEPSAAGYEFTHRHRDTLTSKRDHVVVYDLGGGTFDVSLLSMTRLQHEVVSTAGVNRLGGDDFDEALLGVALSQGGVSEGALTARARARLLQQCRDAKERLNPSSRKITVDLDDALGEGGTVVVPVDAFYGAVAPLVEQTIDALVPVIARSEGLEKGLASVAGIYVVGGASELPVVSRALRERFGRRVHRSPYASAAVAIGLAIASDDSSGFALTDRFSRVFGVFREGDSGQRITFDSIFSRETSLPAREAGASETERSYRAAHNVGRFRFFECSSLGADGRPSGDLSLFHDVLFPFDPALPERDLAAVPVTRLSGDGPRVMERYTLDADGIVEVTIKNLDTGYERRFRLGASEDAA